MRSGSQKNVKFLSGVCSQSIRYNNETQRLKRQKQNYKETRKQENITISTAYLEGKATKCEVMKGSQTKQTVKILDTG